MIDKNSMRVIKYTLFAMLATFVNIAFQRAVHIVYNGYMSLYVAMLVGTLAGLIVKFILDKKYIFYHKVRRNTDNALGFFLYSAMGVLTTGVFWSFELAFDLMFDSESAKYIGGGLGLAVGYCVKYVLDKRFVFQSE